jgi:hypothetical protein
MHRRFQKGVHRDQIKTAFYLGHRLDVIANAGFDDGFGRDRL